MLVCQRVTYSIHIPKKEMGKQLGLHGASKISSSSFSWGLQTGSVTMTIQSQLTGENGAFCIIFRFFC
jgi:hypothetical protein